eukprot:14772242-Alexandrium_andersonii.AAC.1
MRTRLGTELAREREHLLSLQPGQVQPTGGEADAVAPVVAPPCDAEPALQPPPPPPMDAEAIARIRAKIAHVYREHNPGKLPDLNWIMDKCKGMEHALYKG